MLYIFPLLMLALLVAIVIHNRNKAGGNPQAEPSFLSSGDGGFPEIPAKRRSAPQELGVEGETLYQGLLWMKNKYEQDREQSTANYIQLKEEHEQLKEKYMKSATGHAYAEDLLNERQATIDRLREQLRQETLRAEEMKGKLESSGHLLLKMHKELDIVLTGETDQPPAEPQAPQQDYEQDTLPVVAQ